MQKRTIQGLGTISATLFLLFSFGSWAIADVKVAVTQIVEHQALDACREGVKDELAARNFKEGENLEWIFETAQGNPTIAAQVAKKFAGLKPDLIVAISTPSAQATVAANKETNVVFCAVTDPVGARLVKDMKKPGGHVTGTADMAPMSQQFSLIVKLRPNTKKLGFIYNPGEANSAVQLELAKKLAKQFEFKLVESAAVRSSEVLSATRALVGKVDFIYIPTDNTVVSAIESVLKVAYEAKIPVVSGSTEIVEKGVAASLGFDYYSVGRQTGQIVARILGGEAPSAIPVETPKNLELHVNPKSAKKMGLTIPESMLSQAKKVF